MLSNLLRTLLSFYKVRYTDWYYSHNTEYHQTCQLIGAFPRSVNILLIFEKCRQPKKPRYADNGEGVWPFYNKVFVGINVFAFFM